MQNDLRKLLSAFDEEPEVVRQTHVCGLMVSTIKANDVGYETAIVDTQSAYPVERYKSKELATQGHNIWVLKASKGLTTVVRLGYGDLVKEKTVTLKPAN